MRDVDLIDALATRMEMALAAINLERIPVLQSYQPNQQGTPTGDSVWLTKLYDQRYGWPERKTNYIQESNHFDEVEKQVYNTTFQISALVPQIPGDTSIPTASDLLNYLARYLNSRATIRAFRALNIAVFKIAEVKNDKIVDDMNQYEARPSFDIVITHINDLVTVVGAVERVEGKTYPV